MTQPSSAFSSRPHPHLYEINTIVWLNELSRKHNKTIRLGDVPDQEWDTLHEKGFDDIWLMGIWLRSPRSRDIAVGIPGLQKEYEKALPAWQPIDVVGSPYAIRAYCPDPEIATWGHLTQTLEKLHDRNMKLILDFVPNHTALDHEWIKSHPDYYIQGTPQHADARPSEFFPIQAGARRLYLAHGKDPHFSSWTDTVQLNYFNPETRTALLQELEMIAPYCDGVRCDMAMLVLNEVFAQSWGPYIQKNTPPAKEFWAEAISLHPDFVWIAEVYGEREWELQQLGFGFTYDKRLYDRLHSASPQEVALHLNANAEYQRRLVRFVENHDQERSITAFGKSRLPAVTTLMGTLPGMRLYHQGQMEGRRIRIPAQLARARKETPDGEIQEWYGRLLEIIDEAVFHWGEWRRLTVRSGGDSSFENLIAYEWALPSEQAVVVVNLDSISAQGYIRIIDDAPARPNSSPTDSYMFCERITEVQVTGTYEDLIHHGLYVRLTPYTASIFSREPSLTVEPKTQGK